VIGDEDFVFRMRGTSLITKRMVGEIDNCSYYVHPVFNLKFPFFESVKQILFKRHFEWKYLMNVFRDIPNVMGFAWSVLVKRKMYVMNDEWFLYIDIENPSKNSYVCLSKEKDSFGVAGLDVHYHVGEQAAAIYEKAKNVAIRYLDACGADYETITAKIDVQTCEDIYHPYGMFRFDSVEDYFSRWSNMLLVTTGCLSRSGGINPTASMLPVVDEFVEAILLSIQAGFSCDMTLYGSAFYMEWHLLSYTVWIYLMTIAIISDEHDEHTTIGIHNNAMLQHGEVSLSKCRRIIGE